MEEAMDRKIQAVKRGIIKNISDIPDMSREDTLQILEEILEHIQGVIDHYKW